MAENNGVIHLPEEIKKAVLDGYDVYITKSVKEGVCYAKITFHKVKVAGSDKLNTEKH